MSHGDLNFHQTFPPEREHIGRLLLLADNMPFMSKEEIFAATGIPTGASSGKVVPHIKYAMFMGLLNAERYQGKYRLTKSSLGLQIAEKDPYLTEPISQLVCHYHLTSRFGAPLWHFIVREYLPTHGLTVNREDLQRSSLARFGANVNLAPFVSCYTRDTCFGPLGLLRVSTRGLDWSFKEHLYSDKQRYAYAYSLLWEWDRLFPDTPEITFINLQTELRWGAAFLWGASKTLEVLTSLQELGVVKLNRQLDPVTIVRTMSTEVALSQLYSLLG